jgi:hypothetical protein
MKKDWHELIQRQFAGLTTAEESEMLQDALKADAELLTLYLDYANLDLALSSLAKDAEYVTQSRRSVRWLAWRPLAAAAACVSLLLAGALHFSHKPASPQPDLAAVFATTENIIARIPAPSLDPLPAWISPTAAMLEPAGLHPLNF